jgi:hypothetical protein
LFDSLMVHARASLAAWLSTVLEVM